MTARAARWFVVVASVFAGFALLASSASARPHKSKPAPPLALHLHFQSAGQATNILVDGRYVFFEGPARPSGVLLDEQTGKRTAFPCDGTAIGGPYLVLQCGIQFPYPPPVLYTLATGTMRPLPEDTRSEANPVIVAAVGAHWIQLDFECSHCGRSYVFENLDTGQRRGDPTNATTYVDLNSPTLAHSICKPLRVQQDSQYQMFDALPGALSFYGNFVLSYGAVGHNGDLGGYVERCGTRLHQKIGNPVLTYTPFVSNSHLVVWQSTQHQLTGLFLPSLRRFVVKLPDGVNSVYRAGYAQGLLTVSEKYVYVISTTDAYPPKAVWSAPLPSSPPPPKQ